MSATAFSKKDRFIGTDYETITVSNDVAQGAAENTTITADAGEVWEIIGISININSIGSATSGTHQVHYAEPNKFGTGDAFLVVQSQYNEDIRLYNNIVEVGNLIRTDFNATEQLKHVRNLAYTIDEDSPVLFRYRNDSDASQTGQLQYKLLVRKWEA